MDPILDLASQADTHLGMLRFHLDAGRFDLARASLDASLDICASVGEAGSAARLCMEWAAARLEGDPRESAEWLLRAVLPARLSGDGALAADVLVSLAEAWHLAGEPHRALGACTEAMAAAEAADARGAVPRILFFRGLSHAALEQTGEALDALRTAIQGFRALRDEDGQASASFRLVPLLLAEGKTDAALRLLHKSLSSTSDPHRRIPLLLGIGVCQAILGSPGRALETFQRLLWHTRKVRDASTEATAMFHIGRVLAELGRPEEATSAFESAVSTAHACGSAETEGQAWMALAGVHWRADRRDEGLDACEAAAIALRDHPEALAAAVADTAETLAGVGDLEGGLSRLEGTLPLLRGKDADEGGTHRRCADLCAQAALAIPAGARGAAGIHRRDLLRRGRAHCEEALRLLQDTAMAEVHGAVASVRLAEGDAAGAAASLEEAVSMCPDDRLAQAALLTRLGQVHALAGATEPTTAAFERACDLWEDPREQASTMLEAARSCLTLECPDRALPWLDRALPVVQALADPTLEAAAMLIRGGALQALGDTARARTCYEEALRLGPRDTPDACAALTQLGILLSDESPTQALLYLREALPIARAQQAHYAHMQILLQTGIIHARLGNTLQAVEHCAQALLLARAVEDDRAESLLLDVLNNLYRA